MIREFNIRSENEEIRMIREKKKRRKKRDKINIATETNLK